MPKRGRTYIRKNKARRILEDEMCERLPKNQTFTFDEMIELRRNDYNEARTKLLAKSILAPQFVAVRAALEKANITLEYKVECKELEGCGCEPEIVNDDWEMSDGYSEVSEDDDLFCRCGQEIIEIKFCTPNAKMFVRVILRNECDSVGGQITSNIIICDKNGYDYLKIVPLQKGDPERFEKYCSLVVLASVFSSSAIFSEFICALIAPLYDESTFHYYFKETFQTYQDGETLRYTLGGGFMPVTYRMEHSKEIISNAPYNI